MDLSEAIGWLIILGIAAYLVRTAWYWPDPQDKQHHDGGAGGMGGDGI